MTRLSTGVVLFTLIAGCVKGQEPPAPPPVNAVTNWRVVADGLNHDYLAALASPDGTPDVRDSNLPLAALAIEQILMRDGTTWRDETYVKAQEDSEKTCRDALARLKKGEVAYLGQTGGESTAGYLERGYMDRCDGDVQPYFVRLPTGYDAAKKWPLVIFLHGYVPDTSKINPWVLPATQLKLASDHGLILAMPHGRRNSDFLGIGEVDVLRVIEEMRRFYNIDPDRIHLTGCSMGGYGGWAIGLRHPDMFACLSLMSGQTDFFDWEHRPREQTAYKTWCIEQNNPVDLAVNARWLPMQVQHGELDNLVPVLHSRKIVPIMQDLGYDITYHEYKGASHYIYWEDEPFIELFNFVEKKVRVSAPPRVTFKTFTPKQGQAYWVDVRRLQAWGPPAEIDAQVKADGVSVSAKNVAELWLDLPAALAGAEPKRLTINGQAAGTLAAGPHLVRIAADGQVAPAEAGTPPPARPRVGPAREVFTRPFVVVFATGGDAKRQLWNHSQAADFQQLWWAFSEGLCAVYADNQVTEAIARSHNLVIFGEPETLKLPVLGDLSKVIPEGISMAAGQYSVGAHHYTGERVGMYLLTPHPLDPQGLMLWRSGAAYGSALPPNHRFDLLPDVLVYGDQTDWDSTNKYLVGGFLSPNFRLDETKLDVAPAVAPTTLFGGN
jgi:pimeloyl-ACP methyl ester carboxylesterase